MAPKKEKLTPEEVSIILGRRPMSIALMVNVCTLLTKFTRTQTICLEGPLPSKMKFGRKPHVFLLMNEHDRWVCCCNDGRKTLTEYNTNDFTDTTELSTRLLRAYNMQPFELKQSIVKSDFPSPSSDLDSGFVSVAIAALVGKKKQVPPEMEVLPIRQNLVKMMYRGKYNGFPEDLENQSCGKKSKKAKPDEVLFYSLFTAFEQLNQRSSVDLAPLMAVIAVTPREQPVVQEIEEEPRKDSVQDARKVSVEEPKKVTVEEPKRVPVEESSVVVQEAEDDLEQALGLPYYPVDGRRVVKYERGPTTAAVSIASTGVSEDNNIRFIQYERVTKEIHYLKPKSNKSNTSNQ